MIPDKINNIEPIIEVGDISIKDLAEIEDLSVRTINICYFTDLHSLNQILRFYETHKSFKNIRNCGAKSEKELIELCEKYRNGLAQNVMRDKSTILNQLN
jgi:hypothetical protein